MATTPETPEKIMVGENLNFMTREAYNVLRTNLTLSFTGEKKCRVVGLTSAAPHEGKSFTTSNLCYALAKEGYRVILLSGDLRKPMAETILKIEADKGLSNILTGDVTDYRTVVHENVLINGFSVISAGTLPPNPSELLGSQAMGDFLEILKPDFDFIIVDLPPVMSVIDPIAVSKYLDGMIVVVMHNYSRKKNIRGALTQLRYSGVRILGFVYNANTTGFGTYRRKDKYYKHYGDYYGTKKSGHTDKKETAEKGSKEPAQAAK